MHTTIHGRLVLSKVTGAGVAAGYLILNRKLNKQLQGLVGLL